jgi:hypothetical protein
MTLKRLRLRVALVAASLGLLLVVGVVLRLTEQKTEYQLIKDLSPLVIAILAAYLASRFQERAVFVQSLRSLWSQLVEAKSEAVDYTRDPDPSRERYERAFSQLSRAIDEMRSVYKNVGETDRYTGLYPYEPLHDMRRALEALGRGAHDPNSRTTARNEISAAWNAFRPSFLSEFAPPEPTKPIIMRNITDSRFRGPAPGRKRFRLPPSGTGDSGR